MRTEQLSNRLGRREVIKMVATMPFLPYLHRPIDIPGSHDPEQYQYQMSDLEKVLAQTNCSESPIGLVNGHLPNDTEGYAVNFSFPCKPVMLIPDGLRLYGNAIDENAFRQNDPQIDIPRQTDLEKELNGQLVADMTLLQNIVLDQKLAFQTEQKIHQGCNATAVMEIDESKSLDDLQSLIKGYAESGVRTFVIGNEPNDPNMTKRDNKERLYQACLVAKSTLDALKIPGTQISLPGLAYFKDGSYLKELVTAIRSFAKRDGIDPEAFISSFRVADHYYGPVDDLLSRIGGMRAMMKDTGISKNPYDIREIGNPGPEILQRKVVDRELAEGYIPQVLSLCIGSKLVDTVSYYSLLDMTNPDHSLMSIQNGKLIAKDSYRAWAIMTKLLSRIKHISIDDYSDTTIIFGERTDGIEFRVEWCKNPDQDFPTALQENASVYTAVGERQYDEEVNGSAMLRRKETSAFAGSARIIILSKTA